MKPWLLALLMMGASPEEGCDMAQKPILYPGAVLSRNSQMRQAAVQGGAYVPMDGELARFPRTVDEMHAALVNHPGTANKALFARLKNPDQADTNIGYLFSFAGLPGATCTVGLALYEMGYVAPGVFTMTLVEGGFETRSGGSPVWTRQMARPIKMDRTKVYVLGVVSTLVGASMTIAAAATMGFSMTVGPVSSGSMVSTADVTESSGWPQRLGVDWTGGPTDVQSDTDVIFGGTFPVGYATGMGY